MRPKISTDPMYQLLREGNMTEFNARRKAGETPDLTNCDFRSVDLRGLDAKGLDFRGCYFRQADLRGLDMSHCQLEGASLNGARVSGTWFPKEISASEILLSLQHGTLLRYGT